MSEAKWDLGRLSAGERSALRRNAGIMMHAAGMQAIEAFYRAQTQSCKGYEEAAWFAAMCMQSLWREEDHPSVKPLPVMLRQIYQNPDATESTRKRCTGFLDLSWAEDGFLLGKISNLVRRMHADDLGVIPDFDALADDLNHWNHDTHYVQRKWLNTICQTQSADQEKMEENKDVD